MPYFNAGQGKAANKPVRISSVGDWRLRLAASARGAQDAWNYMGVRPGAKAGRDVYDASEPPVLGPYVQLGLEGAEGLLSADYRGAPVNGASEWYMAVRTDVTGPVHLEWSGVEHTSG